MKVVSNNYFIIVILVFLLNCQPNTDKTKLFVDYLKITHSKDLENKFYVIIPLNLCGSCVDKMITIINKKSNINNLIIILVDNTSVTFKVIEKELKHYKILKDNKMSIIRNNIITGSEIVVFKVKNRKIEKIINFEPNINDKNIIELFEQ